MDLGLLAGVASRVGAAAESQPRATGERLALGTRLLLPLLQSSAPSQLASDIRAAVAGRDSVMLLLPPAASQSAARIEVGGRQFALPAALRDALLAALGGPAAAAAASGAAPASSASSAASAAAADATRAWAVAAQTTAAAAVTAAGSGAPRAVQRARDDAPPPALRFTPPLFEPVAAPRPIEAAAERLRHHVERSGLFFESHVAQWARGERSDQELRTELRADALRLSPAAAGESAQRVAAQVALLQDGQMRLEGSAWPGQPMTLTVQREQDTAAEGGQEARGPVFSAHLSFDLPNLGPVEVRLRLAGSAISAQVGSNDAQTLAPALTDLAEQLAARGLRPVMLQSLPAGELQ